MGPNLVAHHVDGIAEVVETDVAVDVAGGGWVTVPQDLLHDGQWHLRLQEKSGCAVASIVKPELPGQRLGPQLHRALGAGRFGVDLALLFEPAVLSAAHVHVALNDACSAHCPPEHLVERQVSRVLGQAQHATLIKGLVQIEDAVEDLVIFTGSEWPAAMFEAISGLIDDVTADLEGRASADQVAVEEAGIEAAMCAVPIGDPQFKRLQGYRRHLERQLQAHLEVLEQLRRLRPGGGAGSFVRSIQVNLRWSVPRPSPTGRAIELGPLSKSWASVLAVPFAPYEGSTRRYSSSFGSPGSNEP